MAITIIAYKSYELRTGRILTHPLPEPLTPDKLLELFTILNNNVQVYGVVYFTDAFCITGEEN